MKPHDAVLVAEARRAGADGDGRRLRLAAKLSLAEVGAVCGVTGSAVSLWETGQRRPHGSGAIAWAKLLRSLREVTSAA